MKKIFKVVLFATCLAMLSGCQVQEESTETTDDQDVVQEDTQDGVQVEPQDEDFVEVVSEDYLFFGGSEAKVLMHYDVDMTDFIHFQFEGDKRILLFAPDQSKALYKVPLSVHTIYEIDYDHPDYEKFPALKHAKGFDFVMNHGDALFIPRGYWHYNSYFSS